MIVSKFDKKTLFMRDGRVIFISYEGLVLSSYYIWYITIIDNEITLYSNDFYLDADKNEGIVKGFPYMKRWKCELKDINYSIYFEDKNNMLTIEENKALLRKENKNHKNQLFAFIDIQKK